MERREVGGFIVSRGVGRAMKLALVALLVASSLALATPRDAQAMADSDGYVPVTYGCFTSNEAGLYNWYFDGYTTYGAITINQCALERLGAGIHDFAMVLAHEEGHAAGLPHSLDPTSIMYPYFLITGT